MPAPLPRFGVLNNIEKPVVSPRVDLRRDNVVSVYKKMVETVYTPNALFNTGPYKGIVLRVEVQPTNSEAGSWANSFFSFVSNKGEPPKLVQIKVRIPEIHSMLPIPETFGPESQDHNIIDMYPTFIAQSSDIPVPAVSSLVWVDFGNKTNFTDPIYLKPVADSQPLPNSAGNSNSKNAFAPCPGKLSSDSPSGDIMAGSNKPLSHTGLPLQPRKSEVLVSKEYEFLKGLRYSQLVLKKWEKAIKSKGVPGKTWLGTTNNNGIEDYSHKDGKRSTIIFVPNTTDFIAPIELIYFFHGIKEFGDNYDFEKRYATSIKSLAESKRNFILVIPELPWSISSKNSDRDAWVGNDDFGGLHGEILFTLKESYSSRINIKFITIIGYSGGGRAIRNAAEKGFEVVKPNRIIFADATYKDYAQVVWDKYVSKDNTIEFNLLVQDGGNTFTIAKDLYDRISSNKNVLFQVMKDKNHKQIGDLSLTFISPILQKDQEEQELESLDIAKQNPNPDPNGEEPMLEDSQKKFLEQPNSKLPLPSNANVSSNAIQKSQDTKKSLSSIKQSVPFEEARVKVSDYSSLGGNENILMQYPCSVSGRTAKVHKLVAKRLDRLNEAWLSENPGCESIKINNGWRTQKFNSQADYEKHLIDKYGSINEGKKWVAFESPHQTGLAIDIGNNGMEPRSKTNDQQKQTRLYKWMRDNAHKYGFTPYKLEAWHWECRLTREAWASGEDFTDNYAVRVESPGQGGQIPTRGEVGQNCVASLGEISNKSGGLNMASLGNNTPGTLDKDKKKTLIEKLAAELGIEPEMAYAFQKVESGGRSGFDGKGRVVIKFEPHVFGNYAKKMGVSSDKVPWYDTSSKEMKQKWIEMGQKEGWKYDSNQDNQYKALQYAININEELAYYSISIGAFQVMGNNHRMMGYESAKKMFEAFQASEELQVRSFFVYVTKRGGMLQALKDKNYLRAAELYNGKSTQAPLYASKIEKYYDQYKGQGMA